MLQHYVLLKYREGTSSQHIDAFCDQMLGLRSRIDGIEHLEIGRDELHDARSWDLILIMRFPNIAALRAYQRHPEHQAVMRFNDPHVTNIAALDFETAEAGP